MWATLALATVIPMTPAQTGLSLKNVRPVYYLYGQKRADATVLPGDLFMVAYDIAGLQSRADGRIQYSIGLELSNAKGESVFRQEPKDTEANNSLGGNTKPAFAYLEIGTDTPPGEYTMKLTVTDQMAKKTESLSTKFTVSEKKFGFVQNSITLPGLIPTPPIAVPGQEYWVNFALVGFGLGGDKQQPDITVEMQIIDRSTGQPTLPNPLKGGGKQVEEQFKKLWPFQFILQLNRPGRFTIQMKATDNVSKQTAVQSLDFEVVQQ